METRRWTNPSQPQTLQIAVFLLYAEAVLTLFGRGIIPFGLQEPANLIVIAGSLAAGFGIANERRWGYLVGIGTAVLPLAWYLFNGFTIDLIGLMFQIALLALLLHPQSRDYQRIWFS
jgi:hypothetical protein